MLFRQHKTLGAAWECGKHAVRVKYAFLGRLGQHEDVLDALAPEGQI